MRGLPQIMKIGFSFVVTMIVYLAAPEINIDIRPVGIFYIFLIKEVLFGLALGYITNLVFTAIQMAGQMTDIQLGFAMSSIYDPVTQTSISLFGRVYNWIGLVLFFTINGHHYLLQSIFQSYKVVPLGLLNLEGFSIGEVINIFSRSFMIAFQIGIPVILVAFMTDIIMGFIARTVPQLNVFILGLPLKVLVGLLAFVILLPPISNLMIAVIEDIPYSLDKIIRLFH